MGTENIGCPNCSALNSVTSPDPSYTKLHSTNKIGSINARYTCYSCHQENKIYWTKD